MISTIKIIIALLLFGCLLNMPYGYYQLVRFVAMAGFAYLAYFNFENNKKDVVWVYLILALIFQPLIKISLGRELWNLVDVGVAAGLIISLIRTSKK